MIRHLCPKTSWRVVLAVFVPALVFAAMGNDQPIDQEIEFTEPATIKLAYTHYITAAARATFERVAPNARLDQIVIKIKPKTYRFGQVYFELFCRVDEVKTEYIISPEGEFLAMVRHLPVAHVPDVVRSRIENMAVGKPVRIAYQWMIRGVVHYEFNLPGNGIHLVGVDGALLGMRPRDGVTGP